MFKGLLGVKSQYSVQFSAGEEAFLWAVATDCYKQSPVLHLVLGRFTSSSLVLSPTKGKRKLNRD